MPKLLQFGFAQIADDDRLCAAQRLKSIAGEPAGFLDSEVPTPRGYHGKPRYFRGVAHQIYDCLALAIVEEVQVVEKKHGAAVPGKVRQQIPGRTVETDHCAHRGPAARGRAARAENHYLAFSRKLLGSMLEYS